MFNINFLSHSCHVDFSLAVSMFLKIFVPLYFLSQAFVGAKRSPGPVFGTTGDTDIGKIWNSKYFRALLKQSKEKDITKLVRHTDNHTAIN